MLKPQIAAKRTKEFSEKETPFLKVVFFDNHLSSFSRFFLLHFDATRLIIFRTRFQKAISAKPENYSWKGMWHEKITEKYLKNTNYFKVRFCGAILDKD